MVQMKCFYCGGDIIWNSDIDDLDENGEYGRIISLYTCRFCGREYEVYEPSEEDKKLSYNKYWNVENETD